MGQRLRTATPMGDWRSFMDVCAVTAGYSQYDLVKIEDTVGMIYFANVVLGDEFVLIYHAEKVIVDKLHGSGEAINKGDAIYWSGVDGTGVSAVFTSGWLWIGIATEDAAADDETVEIDLKGDKATLGEF